MFSSPFSYYFYLISRSSFENCSLSYVVSAKKLICGVKKLMSLGRFKLSPMHILTVFVYIRPTVVSSFDS